MGFFGKKKADTQPSELEQARVLVLGSGCANCNALEQAAVQAMTELGVEPAVGHITDFSKIAQYGVMTTPALVLDGKVLCQGRVLNKEEAKRLLTEAGLKP